MIKIANTGNAPLTVSAASLGGANPADYANAFDGCSGTPVPAGGSCTISITFTPTAAGTRTATLTIADNAPDTPQTVPISGTGATPPPPSATPLAVDTRFMTCSNGVCDFGAGSNVFVNNFYSTNFIASGGTAPYTWSVAAGQMPGGLALISSGLVFGSPNAIGTFTFTVRVTDASGASATAVLSLTVTGPPPPSPPGCQSGGTKIEPLSGPAINGQVPDGEAQSDESQFTSCGGFSILTAQVNNVNLPDGTVLWVSLDFKPVGTITLLGGAGAMNSYNMGRFGVSFNHINIVNHPPPRVNGEPTVLSGGFFS